MFEAKIVKWGRKFGAYSEKHACAIIRGYQKASGRSNSNSTRKKERTYRNPKLERHNRVVVVAARGKKKA